MDITSLEIHFEVDGTSRISCWVKCRSPDDIDDVILWLGLARETMLQWQDIRARRQVVAANVTSIKPPPRPEPSQPFKKG